ncbi:hypothetical protein HL033_00085 [Neoehrlichia mikurensis]|uniref:Uncharacterized protein n=1 Tax=Neoehrlichia mikurensis TaxID=89586 RepID=A0A9Q9F3F2_9RICK|nr:hypothetical protein [Neoehrlichia mikurensis]QXK91984.1 hypothetical protein IAH97_00085 [Neoehrlichia mikurensis]QXK92441.1 hypothetical protein HUN61_00085 [Neoehrlichia mikurensis]QXK93676.1 hypothetical protein HL033_00085 [Neoehrlichia mikurensis]UTO55354.1 hypothetical protein LUA82_04200 [Neoehrlichia mikurensis]
MIKTTTYSAVLGIIGASSCMTINLGFSKVILEMDFVYNFFITSHSIIICIT